MSELTILTGTIPENLIYGGEQEGDVDFIIEKIKEENNTIYYNCHIKACYNRTTKFTFDKITKVIESWGEVSEKYPVFRRMAVEYSDPDYNRIPQIYVVEDAYKNKVYYDDHFADPYYRFPVTKNGIGVSTLYYYIFTTVNGIEGISTIYPKQFNELSS
jgi:hypothetical protein